MHTNACTIRSADTCVFRDPSVKSAPKFIRKLEIYSTSVFTECKANKVIIKAPHILTRSSFMLYI